MLTKLRTLTQTKLSELALTIRLHEQGRARRRGRSSLSDIGREQMEPSARSAPSC